jgi:hypothetical protein
MKPNEPNAAVSLDPNAAVNLALLILDTVLGEINKIKGQSGLTGDQLAAMADQQDLANLAAIKALINPPPITQ